MTRSIRWDGTREHADQLVAWVNGAGGQARYDRDESPMRHTLTDPSPSLAVRTADGWVYASPGDTVTMTDEWTLIDPYPRPKRSVRVFRVVGADHE